jgi:hypothetical protein
MTCATTRSTSPAAAPRTARGAAALPNDPGLHAILADPKLSSTAKAIITVMVLNWAWLKDHCWPSDATLADKVGRSVGHVQRCLRELERAGRISREGTDAVPNGRRIWLLWRCPDGRAGAQRDPAPARTAPPAPARSKSFVIVNEGREPEIRPASRRRLEADPVPTTLRDVPPAAASTSQAEESPKPLEPLPAAQEARETPPTPVTEEILTATDQAPPEAAGGLLEEPAPVVVPDASRAAPLPLPLPLPLGAIGTPMASFSQPPRAAPSGPSASPPPAASTPRSASRRKGLGLDLAELAQVVGATADPILAAELARRTAPPPPSAPPPETLATAELLATLPGRHDLIMVVARRLSEETGDFQVASQRTFEMMAAAVARRSVPAAVLIDCWRQAVGPRAAHKGKVLVAAWKRQAPLRC